MSKIKTEVLYRVVQGKNGKCFEKSHEANTSVFRFLGAQKDGSMVRVSFEQVTDKDAWRDTQRKYHFAYLSFVIENAHEGFLKMFRDPTVSGRINALHYTLKDIFCATNIDCYKKGYNVVTGEEKKEVFSVSRNECHLSDEQLESFYGWSKDWINTLHLESWGYELPYWEEEKEKKIV